MKLDSTKLAIIGLGVFAAIIAIGGYLLVVQPQRTKIATLDAKIGTQQANLAGLTAGGTKRPSLRAAELFQLSRAIPDTPDVPGMLSDLARLAEQSGVALLSVQPTTPTVLADGSTALPLSVTVQGSWSTITSFLRKIRQQVLVHRTKLTVGGRLFDVDGVQVTGPQPTKSGGVPNSSGIQAQLTVNAFVYGSASVPAATSTTSTSTTSTTTTSSSGSQQAAGAPAGGGS